MKDGGRREVKEEVNRVEMGKTSLTADTRDNENGACSLLSAARMQKRETIHLCKHDCTTHTHTSAGETHYVA